MLLSSAMLFVVGAVLLIGGAECLVKGASRLAAAVGVPPLIIGLTVVALGTSTPEIAVSLDAAWKDHADIAMGNVIGSNICNILLVLGVSALIVPLVVAQQLVWRDIPFMIGCGVLLLMLSLDGHLGRLDGLALCVILMAYIVWTIRQSRRASGSIPDAKVATDASRPRSLWQVVKQLVWVLGGLGLLTVGARYLVQAAVQGAQALGLSELVISLVIVAIGTSLPEIATSIFAAWRGERDLAVGNVIGSNLFNIMAVLGLTALIVSAGIPVSPAVLRFDLPVMLAVFVACLPICFTGHSIARWEGVLFISYYAAYSAYLLLQATAHDALPMFHGVMIGFVLPLTAVTLVTGVMRSLWTRRTPDVIEPR